MTPIRVFINEEPVSVPAGSSVLEAVRLHDSALGTALTEGTAFVTDGRGVDLDTDATLHGGSILRVIVSRRRAERRADA